MGEAGRDLCGKVYGVGIKGIMIWYYVGERTEALRASRKNRNRQPQEVGGLGDPPECTRDLGGERLSGFKGRDLR